MDVKSFEQVAALSEAILDSKQWLKEDYTYSVMLWNNRVILVEPPNFIETRVTKTNPGLKGDTAQGGVKSAQIETGASIKVPLFIDQGELIKVDTRTGQYVSRVKG